MNVRLFKPSVGKEELDNIKEIFGRSWLGLGPRVGEFEKKWSDFIGCKESIGVNSCTAALHLALSAFKFKPGKKVLVPVVTFASTAMAVIYNGLEPVFVDVEEDSVGMSMDDLDRKCSKDCVAVLPVHFGGHPVPMDKLLPWAASKGLKVVEDCAHSSGGAYKGKKLGTFGDIGCFSFEEKKCMTTGDGGMICSDDTELIKPLCHSRWVGINKDTWQRAEENLKSAIPDARHWYYEISDVGYKYNMNDLMAAIGLAQLAKLNAMNKRREEIIRRYIDGIKGSRKIKVGLPYSLKDSSYWLFMVRVKERDKFIVHMKKNGVATGVHYMPLTAHPFFSKYKTDAPVGEKIWHEFVTLPLYADLMDAEVDYVLRCIKDFER